MKTNKRYGAASPRRKPREATFEEGRYLARLTASRTPVRVRMNDGAELDGVIDYYDSDALRIEREGEPAALIYKRDVSYLAELDETPTEPA